MTIYTIGHSTRELEEFLSILKHYEISALADVRSIPRSRHTPQFNKGNLAKVLPKNAIAYYHLEKLGGLRHASKESLNLGWHNASFRGYADYMQTADFGAGLNTLLELAKVKTIVLMCAEAVPWRCHRSLIGDALLARKIKVVDIFDARKAQPESLTDFAQISGQTITYPAAR